MNCSNCGGSLLDGQHEIRVEEIFASRIVLLVCPKMDKESWVLGGKPVRALAFHRLNP